MSEIVDLWKSFAAVGAIGGGALVVMIGIPVLAIRNSRDLRAWWQRRQHRRRLGPNWW